ncbi:hypothetical protein JIN85_15065 [Luteolibacter pohnpeiensis]|uniref:Tetratricopeptide repeat protein n=1 Tax=Luteolibacter pohnpeiensis TaxID=454153 RepID=A0A934SCQ9_9BACT|nr:hypothetical protein [Luteolibacter pohnpeiensis]MBK1883737.1 hypothetical protein [Luteolibacter pohnpeiensis]
MIQDQIGQSTAWMQEGLRLAARNEWVSALAQFDESLAVRSSWQWQSDPHLAWLLAAVWTNRADALVRLGLESQALESLDRGIEVLKHTDLAENPAHLERWILALIQRATLLVDTACYDRSQEDFREAETALLRFGDRGFLSALLRLNRARLELHLGKPVESWEDAEAAIEILKRLPPVPEVIEAGIKARSIGCRALAMLLELPDGLERVGDWIAKATDLTEEALAWVRASGFRGPWIADLVRYGAKIYRACQPQFLGAFATEWVGSEGPLAGDLELKREMRNEILLAKAEVEARVYRAAHDREWVERQTRVLKSLQAGEIGLMDDF